METTFSKILDKNESLEMGLKLLRTRGSRDGFFKRGSTRAFFRLEGNIPDDREQFKIDKIDGLTVSKTSFKNLVGMVSSWHEDDFICDIVSRSEDSGIC